MNHGDRRKDRLGEIAEFAACSMRASESLYRSMTMLGVIVVEVEVVLQRAVSFVRTISVA